MSRTIPPPLFTYPGGKSTVAGEVWLRFGSVTNYIEPFCGSCAILFGNPRPASYETVNDADGFIANAWRSIKFAPDAVAEAVDYPVVEVDVHSRQDYLIRNAGSLHENLMADPMWCDPQIGGWWIWGQSSAIRMFASPANGRRAKPNVSTKTGVHSATKNIPDLIRWYSQRMRNASVLCGDWKRSVTPSVLDTPRHRAVAVFLDPPYGVSDRDSRLYRTDTLTISADVRRWAIENGENPRLRIALCGYEGEHDMPDGWSVFSWVANGGWGNMRKGGGNPNRVRERIWFSPHCHGGQGILL